MSEKQSLSLRSGDFYKVRFDVLNIICVNVLDIRNRV